MNKIEQDLFKSIQSSYANGGGDDEQAAERCLSVTLKYIKGLIEYAAIKGYVAIIGSNGVHFTNNSGKYFSTETLINKYIKQL